MLRQENYGDSLGQSCPNISKDCSIGLVLVPGALAKVLTFACLSPGDLVILSDGTPTAGWLQGRSCRGARGFFPSSCVHELCLSSQSRQWHSQSVLLQAPEYSMGQARALMGLSAQLDEELDFREGDVITIIGMPEPGWFEGELEGRRGIFPEGFVELLGPLRTVDESLNSGSRDHSTVNGEMDVSPEEVESGGDEDDQQMGTYGIALYRFQALETNELDFEVGDKIRILRTLEDGWLEGHLKGKTGIFPHRFVKLCPSKRTEETLAQPQEDSFPKNSESSVGESGDSMVEEARPQECEEERPDCDLPEQASAPQDVAPEWIGDKISGQDKNALGTSPDVDLERPLAKGLSTPDLLEEVNGISSQPQVPLHPKVQKSQHYLTAGGSHQGSDPFSSELVPLEARTRDYSSLPPRRTYTQGWSLQKPVPHLQRASSLTGSRLDRLSHFCHPAMASNAQKHPTSTENIASLCCAPERPERRPGLPDRGPVTAMTPASQGDSLDLDSKLTEQLIEFEKSLSGPSTEPGKIIRRFSIMDFYSEKDIVRGSSDSQASQAFPEKRKTLRPPPPRPRTPTPISPHLLVDQSPKPVPALVVRPSRPAPLPPPTQQRMNTASPKPTSCAHVSWEAPEKEDSEHTEKSPAQTFPCPSVLARIQGVEHDLDMYARAQEELSLLLEEKQDESLRTEALETFKSYESAIQSLNLELQQLRGKCDCKSSLFEKHPDRHRFTTSLPRPSFCRLMRLLCLAVSVTAVSSDFIYCSSREAQPQRCALSINTVPSLPLWHPGCIVDRKCLHETVLTSFTRT